MPKNITTENNIILGNICPKSNQKSSIFDEYVSIDSYMYNMKLITNAMTYPGIRFFKFFLISSFFIIFSSFIE